MYQISERLRYTSKYFHRARVGSLSVNFKWNESCWWMWMHMWLEFVFGCSIELLGTEL